MTNASAADRFRDNLGSVSWMLENEEAIKQMFPETWTHPANINIPKVGYKLKLLGVEWISEEELIRVLAFLEEMGIILRDGVAIRRNPHSII